MGRKAGSLSLTGRKECASWGNTPPSRSVYLVSLWFPSKCQSADDPYTWWLWRCNAFSSCALKRQPSRLTPCTADRMRLCRGRVPLVSKRPDILVYPALGKSISTLFSRSSRSPSFISVNSECTQTCPSPLGSRHSSKTDSRKLS